VNTHPSEQCLQEAFFRFGRKIRELAARIWELEDLLIPEADEDGAAVRYEHLQRALIAVWTGTDPPKDVDWVSPEKLAQALVKAEHSGRA
jgi:hypothetical protein